MHQIFQNENPQLIGQFRRSKLQVIIETQTISSMPQTPSILIPQEDESQVQKTNIKAKQKAIFKPACKRFCIILTLAVLLGLIGSKMSKVQQKVYLRLCDVYDCSGQVKTVSRKAPQQSLDDFRNKDTKKLKDKRWELQKILWIYKSQLKINQTHSKQLFHKLNNENTKYFAKLSGYQIRQFSLSNYDQYLSRQAQVEVNKIKTLMQNIKLSSLSSKQILAQISKNQKLIQQRLVIYFLILEHGGVFIDSQVTILEPFETWLQSITSVPFINFGQKMYPQLINPKCVGFFDNDYSSLRLKVNVRRQYEFERKVVVFPGLEQGFLACERGSEYLKKLLDVYLQILVVGKDSEKWKLLNKNEDIIGKTDSYRFYQNGHLIASHIILQEHQAQLLNLSFKPNQSKQTISQGQLSKPHPFTPLAIDSLGLVTINNNIAFHKFKHIFIYQQKCYSYLSKLSMSQMVRTMGKIRFVAKITPYVQWKIFKHLTEGSSDIMYFAQDSFIHQYFVRFLPNSQLELKNNYGLFKGPQVINLNRDPRQNIKKPLWSALSNILWVFWDKGLIRHSKPIIQLCYANLKRSAKASNFTLKVISNENIHQYISKELREKVYEAVKNANQHVSSQTMSDFWRLALIYQNGGVYVDASTFTTGQNFDFIRNITQIPSCMLWNRYGSQPEVLLFFNSLLGSPANWRYDAMRTTKVQWHLSYESNFIAAVKQSQFIKEWLDVFMEWITLPYQQIFKQMSGVGMQSQKWTKTKDRYLLVMDAVKYVAGRRQKILLESPHTSHQSAADFYKIWSLPGQSIGQQKFRGQYNFESRDYRLNYMEVQILNLYKTQYTWQYAEQLLGSFQYQTKFFGLDLRESGFIWDHFYRQNSNNFTLQKFQQIIHPKSVFGKLLLYRDKQLTSNLMRYYNQQSVSRIQLKTTKMSGF